MQSIKLSIIVFLLLMPLTTFAKIIVVASATSDRNVAVFLEKQAEYVISELIIKNDDRNPVRRFELLKKAQQALISNTKKHNDISLELLPVHLEIDRHSKLFPYANTAALNYRVLVSLADHNNDFLQASAACAN